MAKVKKNTVRAKQNRVRVNLNREWKSIMHKEEQSNHNSNNLRDITSNVYSSASTSGINDKTDSPNNEFGIRESLRRWALKFNISKCAVTELLKILIRFGMHELPKDSRTLFETPRRIEMISLTNGKIW